MYSKDEIAKAVGITARSAGRKAEKEAWPFEEVDVRGGKKRIYPIGKLPADVKEALQKQAIADVMPAISRDIAAPIVLRARELTDRQKMGRDARQGVKAAIARTRIESACSQEAAMHVLLANARAGRLDPITTKMLRAARDPRGRSGDGFPAIRTLKRWLSATDLTPGVPQKDMSIPAWAKDFLACYQQPQKPSVEDAYRRYCEQASQGNLPSIHQVRRFLSKLGKVTREQGRMGPRELKNLRPFVRRDFLHLEPNDIWSADGHTFDAEVQHPFHGRPFRPEITTIVDIATRMAVGWSVNLAESGVAVTDALRNAAERYGIPAIFYTDNGSGFKNALLEDEATGLLGRLGIQPMHSLPYNSQSRGVIERLHKTLWVAGAKRLPSYVGNAMDREARMEQFKITRRALKNGGAMPLIPWDLFVRFCEDRIAEYNAKAHRTLGGVSPDLRWRAFESKGWAPEMLTSEDAAQLFRPRRLACRRRPTLPDGCPGVPAGRSLPGDRENTRQVSGLAGRSRHPAVRGRPGLAEKHAVADHQGAQGQDAKRRESMPAHAPGALTVVPNEAQNTSACKKQARV
jgi:putative transposase